MNFCVCVEPLKTLVDGRQVGKQVTVAEILEKDKEDESLRRYKEALLGAAAAAAGKSCCVLLFLELCTFSGRWGGCVTNLGAPLQLLLKILTQGMW